MKVRNITRSIAAGTLVILATLPIIGSAPASAQSKMGGKMMNHSKMSGSKMGGKMHMGMSHSDPMMKSMMSHMSASEKRTWAGMSAAEKQLCMKMCHMKM